MQFVLDNSLTMRWLFGDGSGEDVAFADRILDLFGESGTAARAPAIWPLEVGNVITRAEARGMITEARSTEFLSLLDGMAIHTDPESPDHALGDTLTLARRHDLSTYDAAYLEVSLRRNLPLPTLDAQLQRAADAAGVASP